MISKTAIPIIMLALGMQLNVVASKIDWASVGFASFVKLIVAPLLACLICLAFPVSPLLLNIIVIMTALPSAILRFTQFNTMPSRTMSQLVPLFQLS